MVCASDNVTSDDLQLIETETLGDSEVGTFTELQEYISSHHNGETVNLNKSYAYDSSQDSSLEHININRQVTINGNNFTINGNKGLENLFWVVSENVVLNNITFTNAKSHVINARVPNLTINNSYFINNDVDSVIDYQDTGGKIYNSYFINNTISKKNHFIVVATTNGIIQDCYFINNTIINGSIVGSGRNGTVKAYFKNNNITNGTAVKWNGANGTLTESVFENNYLGGTGSSVVEWNGENGKILDSNFTDNSNINGHIVIWQERNGTVSNSRFINNRNLSSSLISWESEKGTISSSQFINNSAVSIKGGAVRWASKYGTITSSNFTNNAVVNGSAGAVYWAEDYGTISDSYFANNSITNGLGGAIQWDGHNGTVLNTKFIKNHAIWDDSLLSTYGGAIYWNGNYSLINNSVFDKNYIDGINFNESRASSDTQYKAAHDGSGNGAAVYWDAHWGNLTNSNFTNNKAYRNGAAIYWNADYGLLSHDNFINNTARYEGGAVKWHSKHGGLLEYLNFTDNVADEGGAIYFSHWVYNGTLNHSYFRGNNATFGSAIYRNDIISYGEYENFNSSVYINNATFIYNQANSSSIKITGTDGNFTATYYGNDNILNAIYNLNNVSAIFIDGVNPVLGVENSNNGELLYQDAREYSQNITVSILDENDNELYTTNLTTDIYGQVNFTAYLGKKIRFTHLNDVYYTLLSNDSDIPEIIIKSDGNTTYPNTDVSIPLELFYLASGNNLSEGNITVKVANYTVTVPAGTENVIIRAPAISGDYPITLTYTDPYNITLTNTSTLHVLQRLINVTINVDDVTYPEIPQAVVKANVTGNYTITINGTDINITFEITEADKEYTVSLKEVLAPGSYNATVSGNIEGYDAVTNTDDFKVNEGLINVTIQVSDVTYPDEAVAYVTANVTGYYNIVIAGTDYSRNITAGNRTEIPLGVLPAGNDYKANITSNVTNYATAFDNTTFNVNKGLIHLEINVTNVTYPDVPAVSVSANVTGNYTVCIENQTIEVEITEPNTPVNVADINPLAPGSYSANITIDTLNYETAFNSTDFNVGKGRIEVNITVDDVIYPNYAYAVVSANVTGRYIITVNGTNISKEIDITEAFTEFEFLLGAVEGWKNNIYRAETDLGQILPVGSYLATVTSDIDGYETATNNDDFKVTSGQIDVKISVGDVTSSQNATAIVSANVTGKYIVTINGTNISKEVDITEANRDFTVDLGHLDPGKYTAVITSAVDNYEVASSSDDFEVTETSNNSTDNETDDTPKSSADDDTDDENTISDDETSSSKSQDNVTKSVDNKQTGNPLMLLLIVLLNLVFFRSRK